MSNLEFLARYGDDDHAHQVIQSRDYAASQVLHTNPTLSADTLLKVHLYGESHSARTRSLEHPNFTHFDKIDLSNNDNQYHSLNNPNLPSSVFPKLYKSTKNSGTHAKLFEHPNCPIEIHDKAFEGDQHASVLAGALRNPNCPVHRLVSHINHDHSGVVSAVLRNPRTPIDLVIKHGINSDLRHEKEGALKNPSLPYEHVHAAIRSGNRHLEDAAMSRQDIDREDFDYIAAKRGHRIHIFDDKLVAKHYPDGYKREQNTVDTRFFA